MGTHSSHKRCPLVAWLWGPGGLHSWVPGHLLLQSKKTVLGRLPHPGHCTDSSLKHSPILSVKQTYLTCPGASAWGQGFRLAMHLEVTEMFPGNVGWGTASLCFPSASLQLSGTSQEEAYILIWNPDACECCPGNTWSQGLLWSPDHRGQQDLQLWSLRIRVHILVTSKTAPWQSGFQSAWN